MYSFIHCMSQYGVTRVRCELTLELTCALFPLTTHVFGASHPLLTTSTPQFSENARYRDPPFWIPVGLISFKKSPTGFYAYSSSGERRNFSRLNCACKHGFFVFWVLDANGTRKGPKSLKKVTEENKNVPSVRALQRDRQITCISCRHEFCALFDDVSRQLQ